jgi:hypothetical protein
VLQDIHKTVQCNGMHCSNMKNRALSIKSVSYSLKTSFRLTGMSYRRLAGHRKYPELLAENTPIVQPQILILLIIRSLKVKECLALGT